MDFKKNDKCYVVVGAEDKPQDVVAAVFSHLLPMDDRYATLLVDNEDICSRVKSIFTKEALALECAMAINKKMMTYLQRTHNKFARKQKKLKVRT